MHTIVFLLDGKNYKWSSSRFDLGSITSSYLFKITGNDSQVVLYADDTSIIITIKEVLQRALNKTLFGIISWFKDSFLSFNFDKMHNLKIWTINYIDTTLRINYVIKTMANIPYTKFLGWMVDGTLTWDNHSDHFFFQIELCLLCNKSCKSSVVNESCKNVIFFLRTFYRILRHNFFGSTHNIIKIFRI